MYKISRFQIYLIILLTLILQAGVSNRIEIFGAKPDFMLLAVIFFGLFLGPGAGLESGIVTGLLKDIFAFDFFFANTLTMALTGFAVGLASDKFFKESKKTEFIVVALFTVFTMSVHYFIVSFLSETLIIRYKEFFLSSIIPSCLYTALISIPIYRIFINIYQLKEADDYL